MNSNLKLLLSFLCAVIFIYSCSDLMPEEKKPILKAESEILKEEPPRRIKIENLNGFTWNNTILYLNKYYVFEVPDPVKPGDIITIDTTMFKDEKSEKLDDKEDIFRLKIVSDEGYWSY